MMQRNFECGTCYYKSVLAEKLQSHYMAVHGLSHADATTLMNNVTGYVKTGQQFYDAFYELVKKAKARAREDSNVKKLLTSKGYLELARMAADL